MLPSCNGEALPVLELREDVKIIINLGSASLSGLIANSDDRNCIKAVLVSDPSPESFADVFSFLNYRWKSQKPSTAKEIYLFGHQGVNSSLRLMAEIYLGRNSINNFVCVSFLFTFSN